MKSLCISIYRDIYVALKNHYATEVLHQGNLYVEQKEV